MSTAHTIAALCQRSRDISFEKGWLNPDGTDPRPQHVVYLLFLSELLEAFEEVRNNKGLNEIYYEATLKGADGTLGGPVTPDTKVTLKSGELLGKSYVGMPKPCGIPIELADTVIRVCQYCGSNGTAARLADSVKMNTGRRGKASLEEDLAQACVEFTYAYKERNEVFLGMAVGTLFDFCARNGIDLWAAIDEKEAYNRTRPTRHGGKAC